ncbi:MAG: M48 family metallopeptidase [Lewinellaceae bacterium]|nr:M48 family metallopeptidase [Phaeodactylibacter sp.]MCB9352306.1 M48 family metallopeptidase [Lewinellaceae bacterium]
MRRKQKTSTLEKGTLEVNGQAVPVKIYRERRYNVRASIGKRAAILRLPLGMSETEQRERLDWFQQWLTKTLKRNESVAAHFETKTYQDGDTLRVGKRSYRLRIHVEDRQSHSGKLDKDKSIHLKLSQHDQGESLNRNIQHLLSRIVAQDFLPEITRRVRQLNDRHFQRPIQAVRLKYNFSNWGSCSAKKNINLSTRLLFAPDEVIDYVIIHELAHLIELNHSPRFWKLVEKAMPDYEEKERWLKEEGGKLGF